MKTTEVFEHDRKMAEFFEIEGYLENIDKKHNERTKDTAALANGHNERK